MSTHEVTNQAPPLAGYDALAGDVALREAVEREGAGWALADLHDLGRRAGDAAWLDRGARANAHPPVLRTHDRYGHRVDEVEFDPTWHELMGVAVGAGLAGRPWADPRPGAHVARAAGNVNVLDVLRVLAREPATAEALLTEIGAAAGGDARLDAFTAALAADLHALPAALADGRAERGARRLVERMALALQASLLVRHSPAEVADAFCAARLGAGGWAFGTLPDEVPAGTAAAIVARATPHQPHPHDPREILDVQIA